MKVIIIDYNSGNLASLKNSLKNAAKNKRKSFDIKISNMQEDVIKADKIILPGVGDFYNCKKQLSEIKGMYEAINFFIKEKERPFLGICIGMQLMANVSYERGKNVGLKLVDAKVVIIKSKNNNDYIT